MFVEKVLLLKSLFVNHVIGLVFFFNSKPVYTASSQTVLGFPAFREACFVSRFMSVYRMASILTLNISHCGELCDSSISDDQIIKK